MSSRAVGKFSAVSHIPVLRTWVSVKAESFKTNPGDAPHSSAHVHWLQDSPCHWCCRCPWPGRGRLQAAAVRLNRPAGSAWLPVLSSSCGCRCQSEVREAAPAARFPLGPGQRTSDGLHQLETGRGRYRLGGSHAAELRGLAHKVKNPFQY